MSQLKDYIQNAIAVSGDGDLISSNIPYPKLNEEVLTGKRHPVSGKPIYTKILRQITNITANYDGSIVEVFHQNYESGNPDENGIEIYKRTNDGSYVHANKNISYYELDLIYRQ